MCERDLGWLPVVHPQLGTWPTTQACALARNQSGDLSVCRTMPNPLGSISEGSADSQAAPQTTECWHRGHKSASCFTTPPPPNGPYVLLSLTTQFQSREARIKQRETVCFTFTQCILSYVMVVSC